MLLDKLRSLFGKSQIPQDARELLKNASSVRDLLEGLDKLITENEVEVDKVTQEIASLEEVEAQEMQRVRGGELPDRSKNNVLRRIQRLRKQMDNLEERQQIYNRNISLQIDLVGRVQALDAMELRGVDEDRIDEILGDYEDELTRYQGVLDTENLSVTSELTSLLDDSSDLAKLEAEVLGAPESVGSDAQQEASPKSARRAEEKPATSAAKSSAKPPEENPPKRVGKSKETLDGETAG
ncbi:MAG: hypothetical protein AAF581_16170 [Planctomycetota bacterium]